MVKGAAFSERPSKFDQSSPLAASVYEVARYLSNHSRVRRQASLAEGSWYDSLASQWKPCPASGYLTISVGTFAFEVASLNASTWSTGML